MLNWDNYQPVKLQLMMKLIIVDDNLMIGCAVYAHPQYIEQRNKKHIKHHQTQGVKKERSEHQKHMCKHAWIRHVC